MSLSFCDSSSNSLLNLESHLKKIHVQIGNRPSLSSPVDRPPPVRKSVRRDNRVLNACSLPKFASYNMRSLMPKIDNVAKDMEDRMCGIIFLTEIWEKSKSKRHQYKIEELFEMKGIKYISTARVDRVGGGAAIAANSELFSLDKLENIVVPKNLEIVWGILKPVEANGKFSRIITACFYSPPKSKKKSLLIDHITLTLQRLKTIYPKAGVIISGDRNDLKLERLDTIDSTLKQIVNMNTRGNNILTVVLTDLKVFYNDPQIAAPIDVDPNKPGVPSDHNGVVVSPLTDASLPPQRKKLVRTVRPISASSLQSIGRILTLEDWGFMDPSLSPTQLTDIFQYYTGEVIDLICPEKQITYRPSDKPYINEKIKSLKRIVMREYEKKGKSTKYFELKSKLQEAIENEVQKYKAKLEENIVEGDRTSCYKALRKLGARPGENTDSSFEILSHVTNNLSPAESVELIADHFGKISNEYEPINLHNFPPNIKSSLSSPDTSQVPSLSDFDIYKKLCAAKKPNSTVPGDVPKKIMKEFSCEFSSPIKIIFNSILSTLEYPRQWVIEYQTPIPKVKPPNSEDDLRNIAKTAFLSKVFESFLADWLLPITEPFIDPCQYGLKGASISHYLVKLLQFIHDYLDLRNPHAVIIALVDLSKAFNRISHGMVIEDLFNMHVPPWILRILMSYLNGRSMILSYKGLSSSFIPLPGSSPQGAFLGIFLFIVKFNAASLRPAIPRLITGPACSKSLKKCSLQDSECSVHCKDMHAIYIDDLSEAEAINLKKQLIPDSTERQRPLTFYESKELVFPVENSLLQKNLTKVENFTIENKMKINSNKSSIMVFNKSRKYLFPPEFSFSNGELLESLDEVKLLGIQLNTNLRWTSHIDLVYKKAMSRMWLLRRMKSLKLDKELILQYYLKEVRPLAEHGVVVWNSGVTKAQIKELEKIQRVALLIILGQNYVSYEKACHVFNLATLRERREQLCINFAIKLYKSDRSEQFFTKVKETKTRNTGKLVEEPFTRTKRCFQAPLNYLRRLVNQNSHRISPHN